MSQARQGTADCRPDDAVRDSELLGNLGIGQAAADERYDVAFASGQACYGGSKLSGAVRSLDRTGPQRSTSSDEEPRLFRSDLGHSAISMVLTRVVHQTDHVAERVELGSTPGASDQVLLDARRLLVIACA